MAAENKKVKLLPLVKKITDEDCLSIADAAKRVGVHPETARKWFKEEGYVTRAPKGRKPNPDNYVQLVCAQCGTEFTRLKSRPSEHCSVACSNKARGPRKTNPTVCPCGNEVGLAPGARHIFHNKKYCSDECRKTYTVWRQKDPEKWSAKTCQNCGNEFELRKSSISPGKYCSNECAQKHTKTKQHIVVDDATVLDSGYEALFWGLCRFHKVPIERYDREQGVEWSKDCWYAPDFLLPSLGVAVELKGVEDPEDDMRWEAFTEQRGALVVLLREDLEALLCGRGALLDALTR